MKRKTEWVERSRLPGGASGLILAAAGTLGIQTGAIAQDKDPAAIYQGQPRGSAGSDYAEPMADQALGKAFHVEIADLPEPFAEPAVRNPALIVERGDREPKAPEGFEVGLFAEGLAHPRNMLVLDNGDVLLAQQKTGDITLLRDADGDGKAEFIEHFAQGFGEPYGLAPGDGHDVLVADAEGIWVVPRVPDGVRASGTRIYGAEKIGQVPEDQRHAQVPMDHFPLTETGIFGVNAGHTTRSLVKDPKTGRLYVGVGSAGNLGIEPEVKATIQTFEPDGSGQRTFASGMRNPIGLRCHPKTGALWAIVQERDGLGDRLVPDYLTEVKEGGF